MTKTFIARLNFEADKPNLNRRVYPRAILEAAFEKFEGQIPVWRDDRSVGNLSDIIGLAKLREGSQPYEFEITTVSPHFEAALSLIGGNPDYFCVLTTTGRGTLGNDNVICKDFELVGLFVTIEAMPKEPAQ